MEEQSAVKAAVNVPENPGAPAAPTSFPPPTTKMIQAMLAAAKGTSDLIFSPGRPPQVELNGELRPVTFPGLTALTPDDTKRIAADLMGRSEYARRKLEQEGSADISYSLPGLARFRLNIFRPRGTSATASPPLPMRLPTSPTLT